jgi:predicted ABC-type ATPase
VAKAPRAVLKIPLINADRMMMSILPEPAKGTGKLPAWAQTLRDNDQNWMKVAQDGVQAFVAQALARKVHFAFETVFSHWVERDDDTFESKVDQIRQMQDQGYFVVLFFVGLSSADLSIARVETRTRQGGHAVDIQKLIDRFPRTQKAVNRALDVVDAAIMVDNSREEEAAFTVCQIRAGADVLYDWRDRQEEPPPVSVLAWLERVAPRNPAQDE